jgi:uncharacterized protein YabE (DUF348 family)
MSIQHQSLTETKTVIKPWGQEKWIQQGQDNHSYVLKEIILNEDGEEIDRKLITNSFGSYLFIW